MRKAVKAVLRYLQSLWNGLCRRQAAMEAVKEVKAKAAQVVDLQEVKRQREEAKRQQDLERELAEFEAMMEKIRLWEESQRRAAIQQWRDNCRRVDEFFWAQAKRRS